MLDDLKTFARYAAALPGFLRAPLSDADCRARAQERLNSRQEAFLSVLQHAVYGHPSSPYRALLDRAGIELGDVERMVTEDGVEGALGRLHGEGVYVTLEEFKGTRAIERPGLTLTVRPDDFDSPLVRAAFVTHTAGSRGPRRRTLTDLRHTAEQAVYHSLFVQSFGLADRPVGLWRAAPPGTAGIGAVLGFSKAGHPIERWFSPNRLSLRRGVAKDSVFTAYTVLAGRISRRRLPYPEFVPLTEARRVAAWVADKKKRGTPPLLNTTSSSGVRVCLAAEELGVDIAGSFFRLSGEPYTEGKARVLERNGVRAVANYSMGEVGRVGIACADPLALDDLHLMIDRLGVIQRERAVQGDGATVASLLFTTLQPTAPKLLLNVESDDYATLDERECRCLLGALGFTRHLRDIRSYDKLTSEGMTFLGSDLIALLDEVLPARFGGNPTDYQLVEKEVDGLPRVSVVIAPSVGDVDEAKLVEVVLTALAAGPGYKRMMADVWRGGTTVRVERREPYRTGSGKILSLHVAR